MRAQAEQNGGEVGVAREDDELVEARGVVEIVAHIAGDANVRAVLEL
jgi:hypothetical protein